MSVPRRWSEVILAVGVLLLAAVFAAYSIRVGQRLRLQKELMYELQIMRSAINLYKVVNRANPSSLQVVALGTYSLAGDDATYRYMQTSPIDSDGRVADPFGAKYHYDAATGWIRSESRGYEFW